MPANPSLSNALSKIESRVNANLPAGMNTGDVQWLGTAGFNTSGKAKWARSTYTELNTTSNASGWSRVQGLYTLQLFYAAPTQGGIRNTMLADLDALKSAFSLKYFDSVTIVSVTTQNLGVENDGTWFNQNLILNFTCEGRI